MQSKFFNVHSIQDMSGLNILTMTQFNSHSNPDFDNRLDEAAKLAEELAASGQPTVIKEVIHGTRINSLIWQSFNSKDRKSILEA